VQVSLVNADLTALLPRAAAGRARGRITLRVDAGGAGLSPAALIGALHGQGTVTAENLLFAGLDPNAIDAATRAAERGVALDGVRIGDIVRTALDGGRLHIPMRAAPSRSPTAASRLRRSSRPPRAPTWR
jgi:hypothetical protein